MNKINKKIHVLHFYKTSYPYSFGGIEQVIHQLCLGGLEKNIVNEVLVLSSDGKEDTIELGGYKIHRVKQNFEIASTGFSLSAFRRFRELAENADIIHFHYPWPFMDMVHILSRIKKPSVVSYHSDIIRQKILLKLYGPLNNYFLSRVDRIIAASPNYLASSDILERYKHKVEIIPYGLDKQKYLSPTKQTLDKWRDKVGGKFFLFLGVLRYYKGLHVLLDALAYIDYPVIIAGAGPIQNELQKQAERLGLKNLYFVSAVSEEDKVALFTQCYAVVFPSHLRSEAFGISLLEGAMYGKPLISTEIGTGTTYINIDKQTGLVIPPSDPESLSRAMSYLWENPNEANRMGENSAARYLSLFQSKQMIEKYISLYLDILSTPS